MEVGEVTRIGNDRRWSAKGQDERSPDQQTPKSTSGADARNAPQAATAGAGSMKPW